MTKFSVICTHTTDAAHRLQHHAGKCKNLHGHRYVWKIEFAAKRGGLNEDWMVVDFTDVKTIIRSILDERFDHTTILEESDPLAELLNGHTQLTTLQMPPTAEVMAMEALLSLQREFLVIGICILSVSVQETDDNEAIAVSE